MDKFLNKYRIPSTRLQTWNYGSPGLYFITICTQHRQHYFGEIINHAMQLNALGIQANNEWIKTPEIRPDMHLQLGEHIIMPNHFHGIVMIGENEYNSDDRRDAMHGVSTSSPPPSPPSSSDTTPQTNKPYKKKFGPQSKNMASVIRGYKSAVTTWARKNNIEFGWQARFHDHIIRNHQEFLRISQYIQMNPFNWKDDKFWSF